MIIVSSVHISTQVSRFWPRQVCRTVQAIVQLSLHPLKDHQPRPLRMCTNISAGLKQVRIIEVPDKWGPDNRGCTVPTIAIYVEVEALVHCDKALDCSLKNRAHSYLIEHQTCMYMYGHVYTWIYPYHLYSMHDNINLHSLLLKPG